MTQAPVLVVIGTRPEAIKLWPVIEEMKRRGVPHYVVSTDQQPDLLPPLLEELGIDVVLRPSPSFRLSSTLPERVACELACFMQQVIVDHAPSLVLVQGDTASAFAGALAAFLALVPVAHVEAGLRTNDLNDPFPEEGFRQMISRIATLHFCPTPRARKNLVEENVDVEETSWLTQAWMVGNTGVDAAARMIALDKAPISNACDVLVTFHRRESWEHAEALVRAVVPLATEHGLRVRWVLHANPKLRERILGAELAVPIVGLERGGLEFVSPMGYASFLGAMLGASCIVTDSGGVIEEATTLGKPLVVVRHTSERLESYGALVSVGSTLLETAVLDAIASRDQQRSTDVFGDGLASERIVEKIVDYLARGTFLDRMRR